MRVCSCGDLLLSPLLSFSFSFTHFRLDGYTPNAAVSMDTNLVGKLHAHHRCRFMSSSQIRMRVASSCGALRKSSHIYVRMWMAHNQNGTYGRNGTVVHRSLCPFAFICYSCVVEDVHRVLVTIIIIIVAWTRRLICVDCRLCECVSVCVSVAGKPDFLVGWEIEKIEWTLRGLVGEVERVFECYRMDRWKLRRINCAQHRIHWTDGRTVIWRVGTQKLHQFNT